MHLAFLITNYQLLPANGIHPIKVYLTFRESPGEASLLNVPIGSAAIQIDHSGVFE